MKRKILSRIACNTISMLVILILISLNNPTTTRAAPSLYYGWLSPSVASQSTYRVTLTISDLYGVAPPSSRWYGPNGSQVNVTCGTGNVIREYVYSYGALSQVKDYFYVSGCNREPGQYRVTVGGEIDKTFTVQPPPTYYNYLPLILK